MTVHESTNDTSNGATNGTKNGVHKNTPLDVSIAMKPANLASAPGLLKQLAVGLDALLADKGSNDTLRQDLSNMARDLMLALETPRETSMKHIWADVRHATPFF